MEVLTGNTESFKGIGQIKCEGPQSDNPLAYCWYDESKVISGKTMKDHLRFAVEKGEPATISIRQEYLENLINRFI